MAELWTRLGGNQHALRGYERHLVHWLGTYRTHALAHVIGALTSLQGLSADLEELRDRVAAPELVGQQVPIEVHLRSVRNVIERLKVGKSKAEFRETENVRRVLAADSIELL